MIGIIPYAGTSFSTYEMLKKYRADKAREEGLKPTDPSPYQRLIFGGIAGLLGQGMYIIFQFRVRWVEKFLTRRYKASLI